MEPKQTVCEICGKLVDEVKYRRHLNNAHKNKREFRCNLCGKEFTKNYNLQYHVAHHLNKRNYVCTECPRAYNTLADLAQHYRIHEKRKDPKTGQFSRLFSKISSQYKTVKQINKNDKRKDPEECPVCGMQIRDVKKHQEAVHLNIKNHECDICRKKFYKKSGLKRHFLVVHEQQRNYICDLCGKAFGEKSLLTKHRSRHDSIRTSFYCTICKKYVVKIKNHYETVHKNLPFACNHCYRRFAKEKELKNHVALKHTEHKFFCCDLCSKTFKAKFQLKSHLKLHSQMNENYNDNTKGNESDAVYYQDLNLEQDEFCSNGEEERNYLSKLNEIEKVNVDSIYMKQELDESCEDMCYEFSPNQFSIKSEENSCEDSSLDSLEPESLRSRNKIIKGREKVNQGISCNMCQESFHSKKAYRKHFLKKHNEKRKNSFSCNECDKTFLDRKARNDHVTKIHLKLDSKIPVKVMQSSGHKIFCNKAEMSRHINREHKMGRKRRCIICKEVLKNSYWHRKHYAQVHLNGKKLKRTCGYCKSEFELYDEFKEHIRLHFGFFICITCGSCHTDNESLKHHEDMHKKIESNLRKFICDMCGHRMFTKFRLTIHMLNHLTNSEEHYCDVCGKGFKFASSLYTHLKYHDEGKFVCSYCGKKFAINTSLVMHLRTHTREKPFKCTVCDRGFAVKLTLTNHLQTHPETRKLFKCKQCGVQFADKKQLIHHEDQAHPEARPFRCFICDISYKQEHHLKKHYSKKH